MAVHISLSALIGIKYKFNQLPWKYVCTIKYPCFLQEMLQRMDSRGLIELMLSFLVKCVSFSDSTYMPDIWHLWGT